MTETVHSARPRKRGPYAKTAARRKDILDAATVVFARSGYRAGSLKEIAALVGIDASSILHHFPTKELLLQAVLEVHDAESDEIVARAAPVTPDRVPQTFLDIARNNERTPGLIGLYTLLAAESATEGHPGGEYFRARYERIRGQFIGAFTVLQAEQLLAPGVTPEYAGTSLLALWDGIQMQWLIDPDAVDVVDYLRRHLRMLTTINV